VSETRLKRAKNSEKKLKRYIRENYTFSYAKEMFEGVIPPTGLLNEGTALHFAKPNKKHRDSTSQSMKTPRSDTITSRDKKHAYKTTRAEPHTHVKPPLPNPSPSPLLAPKNTRQVFNAMFVDVSALPKCSRYCTTQPNSPCDKVASSPTPQKQVGVGVGEKPHQFTVNRCSVGYERVDLVYKRYRHHEVAHRKLALQPVHHEQGVAGASKLY